MQSLAFRNGCKLIINDLLDICLDVIIWSLLSLPVTQWYIEISYREGKGKVAPRPINPLVMWWIYPAHPLTQTGAAPFFFIIIGGFWVVQAGWPCSLTINHHIWNRRTYQLTTAGKQSIWDFLLAGRTRWGKAAICNKKSCYKCRVSECYSSCLGTARSQ